jgi:retron-type reverse transcriptase
MESAAPSANKPARYTIGQSPLYRMKNHRKLAALLGISIGDLRKLRHSDQLYTEFDIPKKNGSPRRVENPARRLKHVQARIARLLSRIEPPDYLYCPVKGRSYIANAAQHLGNRAIRCLDIKKYFPSTTSYRVHWFFRSVMRCENDIADTLTYLSTYRGHLPTGSPLSPILAYFAHCDIWEAVAQIARANELTLTVYIDDVTVSGRHVPKRVIWEIEKTIYSSGLRYHKAKRYFDRPAEITGVVVGSEKLLAPKRQHKKLHQATLALGKAKGLERKKAISRIAGLAGQLDQISTRPTKLHTLQ